MPRTKPIKLKYVQAFTLTPDSSSVQYKEFRANSLFDPDYSVGGHQPYGFDQLATFYQHYVVIGSKITVTPSKDADLTYGGAFGVTLSSTSGLLTGYTATELMERPETKGYALMVQSASGMSSGPLLRARGFFSAKKYFGIATVVGHTQHQASVGANPTEDALFSVWYGSTQSSTPTACNFVVEIEYIAIFTEKKELEPS